MTRRDFVAHLLREAGDRGVTTSELLHAGAGARYGARILELRDAGWMIESAPIEDANGWRYTLISEPIAAPDEIFPSMFPRDTLPTIYDPSSDFA